MITKLNALEKLNQKGHLKILSDISPKEKYTWSIGTWKDAQHY